MYILVYHKRLLSHSAFAERSYKITLVKRIKFRRTLFSELHLSSTVWLRLLLCALVLLKDKTEEWLKRNDLYLYSRGVRFKSLLEILHGYAHFLHINAWIIT
jgi:hypothetical protein